MGDVTGDEQDTPPVTPAMLREVAAQAEALAERIADLERRLGLAADEPTRGARFRLPTAAGEARRIAADLGESAEDLARIRGRSGCVADWGVCPEHGATPRTTGDRSWCEAPGCQRSWGYIRLQVPCAEPATHTVTDMAGATALMCSGHAMFARATLTGAVATPGTGSAGDGGARR